MSPNDRTVTLLRLVRAGETGIMEGGEGGVSVRKSIQELCLSGIPDEPRYLRPAIYHQLLNLPPHSAILPQYTAFVDEISSRVAALLQPTGLTGRKLGKEDQLLREIERDLDRTFAELAWFGGMDEQGGTSDPLWDRIGALDRADEEVAAHSRKGTPNESLADLIAQEGDTLDVPTAPTTPTIPDAPSSATSPTLRPRTRRQALLRPLYIYATLNPGVSYVQGMHSIVAVFYWIISASGESSAQVEASTFFALGSVLSQLRDLYVRSLDGTMSPASPRAGLNATTTGLGATLARFTSLLTWLDPNVAASLEHKQVDPALYVFKWLTTLFASDFSLPDLVRIWDRLFLLFPSDDDAEPTEVLSPVLGHLVDISLAIVLLERPVIVSPFSNFQKCIALLQDPQIEGNAVDRLLGIAWEIRERRIGKGKVVAGAGAGGTETWRAAAGRWSAAANQAAVAASTGPKADSFRSRFFGATTASTAMEGGGKRLSQAAAAYDLDDSMSVAESDTSTSEPMLYASKGQRVGVDRDDALRGKVLPPPPDEMDNYGARPNPPPQPASPLDSSSGDDDYTDSDEERDHAESSWSVLKSRVAASDAAASLFKATTNLSIQAQILREEAPERIARMKEGVTAASGRLYPGSPAVDGRSRRGTGSPTMEQPFTPPGWGSPKPPSPPPFVPNLDVLLSPGTKPLLLSRLARQAANGSTDSNVSPPTSQRGSASAPSFVRSASFVGAMEAQSSSMAASMSSSPIQSSNGSAPPSVPDEEEFYDVDALDEGLEDKTPTIPASAFTPRHAAPASFKAVGEDAPIESRRFEESPGGGSNGLGGGLRRSLRRAEDDKDAPFTPPTSQDSPAQAKRGWTLSDAPVRTRPAPLDISFDKDLLASQLHDSPSTEPTSSIPTRSTSLAEDASVEGEVLQQRSRVTRRQPVSSRRGSGRSTRSISSMQEVEAPAGGRPERISSLSAPERAEEDEVEVIVSEPKRSSGSGRPAREQRGGRGEGWDEQSILAAYGEGE